MKLIFTFAFRIGLLIASFITSPGQMLKISAEIQPTTETTSIHASSRVRAVVTVKLPEGYHMQSNKPSRPLLVPTDLKLDLPKGIEVVELVYPKPIELKQDGLDDALAVFEREYHIGVVLKIGDHVPDGNLLIPLILKYQPCDESMCYPPTSVATHWQLNVVAASTTLTLQHVDVFGKIAFGTGQVPSPPSPISAPDDSIAPAATPRLAGVASLDQFTVIGKAGGYLNSEKFIEFIKNAESGAKEVGIFEGRGPLAIILLVLLGGFALNLTPCVLPMIPINLAIIGAGAQAGSSRRGFLLGATYGAAMAVVYGLLGLVVILTAGTFGALNASPWFNLGIATLFLILGLAMFDVFIIDFSRWSGRFNPNARRGSFVLAFSMGAVAAMLAGACVAPVVIQVILFSSNLYASGTRIALALPFFLGIGMAIPWPIAGAGLSALPKPGMWMKRVKQAFGILIIASSLYYGFLTYEIFSNRAVDSHEVAASANESIKEGWHASLEEGLMTAGRENKPVIIDIWASWCKNCLTMDQTTFKNPEVKEALDGYVKIKIQAENPDQEPVKSIIQRFKIVGLPSYIILSPSAKNE